MRWWDDAWLFDAFAKFMAIKAVEVVQPEWIAVCIIILLRVDTNKTVFLNNIFFFFSLGHNVPVYSSYFSFGFG